ncbi:hypothetical protein THAOC_20757, partial [Thalassiosira oceanica]
VEQDDFKVVRATFAEHGDGEGRAGGTSGAGAQLIHDDHPRGLPLGWNSPGNSLTSEAKSKMGSPGQVTLREGT